MDSQSSTLEEYKYIQYQRLHIFTCDLVKKPEGRRFKKYVEKRKQGRKFGKLKKNKKIKLKSCAQSKWDKGSSPLQPFKISSRKLIN